MGTANSARTGRTICLLEDHKSYLQEAKVGAALTVQLLSPDMDAKRFRLQDQIIECIPTKVSASGTVLGLLRRGGCRLVIDFED